MSKRKGTPCACETDPCGCGSSRNCVRAVNNVSPDPNGDLVIRGGTGIEIIQSGDDLVINNTANPNAFVAGNNIELNPSGDDTSIDLVDEPVVNGLTVNGNTQLNGDLEVNGDIIQNGAAYETHAEKIYTRDDYIIMRDGAIAALAPGDYAGFQVKLYDGVNDGRLVIDSSGTARVGDVGDEEPLLTRDESADLTNGALFKWDAANYKAINEGTVGSDTKPIKIVNGVATAVTDDLWKKQTPVIDKTYLYCNNYIMIGEKLALCWGYIAITWSNTVQRFTVNLPVTAASADDLYPILQRAMSDGTWWSEVYFNIEANRRTTTSFDIDVYSNKTGDTGSGYAHYIVIVQTV